MANKQSFGFSLIELVVALAVFGIIGAVFIADFIGWSRTSGLDNTSNEIISALKLAQSRTLASDQFSQHGVFFDSSQTPNRYVLFMGPSYEDRNSSFDEIRPLANDLEFYDINFGGGNEAVFNKLAGGVEQQGSVSLRMKTHQDKTKTIYMDNYGTISLSLPSVSDAERIKDSRHIHLDYSRNINIAAEQIILNFNDGQLQASLPIVDNLSGGQFYWSGSINVAGEPQAIEIKTNRLNSPDTQFCIHRDARQNTKPLKITISSDTSGTAAEYSADGKQTNFSSIYVQNLNWQ